MTKSLTIPTRLGLNLAALYDAPATPGPHPLVILLHGFLGWKEEGHLATLAAELAQSGIAAIRFDAPGSGESQGTWAEHYRVSNYLAAVADVLTYATANLPVDPQRIGLWAHSMGGLVAVTAAGQLPGVAALCGSEPTTGNSSSVTPAKLAHWRQAGWREYPSSRFGAVNLPIAYYDDRAQYNGLVAIKDVHVPSLFIAGTNDHLVSAASVKKLYKAAHEPKQYLEFPTNHFYKKDPGMLAKINAATVEFFVQVLRSV
ncbi:MAG: peptidase [Patescibacteria group bacterium]|nr:peptidase [Patescibacteria group bacterium]